MRTRARVHVHTNGPDTGSLKPDPCVENSNVGIQETTTTTVLQGQDLLQHLGAKLLLGYLWAPAFWK